MSREGGREEGREVTIGGRARSTAEAVMYVYNIVFYYSSSKVLLGDLIVIFFFYSRWGTSAR